MKHLIKLPLLLLAFLLPATAIAHDFEVDGIYYNIIYYNIINDNKAEVTYPGSNSYLDYYSGDVSIPNTVTYEGVTYSVTYIGDNAFKGCTSLASITIPNSVTYIGYRAFEGCTSLANITIPNSVTSIGGWAFYDCSSLTNITIPNSVTSIGSYTFKGTPWYDNQSEGVIYAGLLAYNYKGTMPEGTCITLREGTIGISNYAFSGCSGLTSITIPNSVTSIGYYAFNGCSSLTSITIPTSVTSIGHEAFKGTPWYNNQPEGVVYAGLMAYEYKGTMPEGTCITLREGTIGISSVAFNGCSGLTSITIPNSVTNIGELAFGGCSSLTSIDIPNSVTSIDCSAFWGCTGLTSINIPYSVTSIMDCLFSDCPSLTNVSIPNRVTYIGDGAFSGCSSLLNITIPDSVTTICMNAFHQCSSLTNITIPNSVTWLGDEAFSSCSRLSDVYSYITDISRVLTGCSIFYLNSEDYANRTLHVPYGTSSAYQANDRWSAYFGSIVEMDPVPATSISLNRSNAVLTNGETTQLIATILPVNADKSVSWASSNPGVATVDGNGLVTAVNVGTATITAMTTDGSNLSASCAVTVRNLSASECFSVNDLTAFHGDTIVIPVAMVNEASIISFQTDIYLPEGLELLQEDGEYLIDPSPRMTTTHSIMSNAVSNGSIRVVCYSANYKPFKGESGDDLFYLTVKVADDAEGDYTVQLKNTLFTTSDFDEIAVPDAAAIVNVMSYIPGDANNSGTVTVTDVVVTSQYILELDPEPFNFTAADVNEDGSITVTDVSRIAWMVLNPASKAPLLRAPALWNNGDQMSGNDLTLAAGETRRVSITLDNALAYSAFQLDLKLPEGLTASNFALTDRAGSHAFDVNTLHSGAVRALCYSPALTAIRGHEGALLTFDVTATGTVNGGITVDGIELVTTDCQTVILDGFNIAVNSVTSVNELSDGKAIARIDYFNLAGQQVDRPDSGVTLVVTTYTDGTRTTTKLIR